MISRARRPPVFWVTRAPRPPLRPDAREESGCSDAPRGTTLERSKDPSMKNWISIATILLFAAPAVAETWVTVVTMTYTDLDPHRVAYQIDAQSVYRKGSFTYARGRFNYQSNSEVLIAQCLVGRLKIGADRVYPEPYWILKKNGVWLFDNEGESYRGQRRFEEPVGRLSTWMDAVLDFMCAQ